MTLLGQNVNSYGRDLSPRASFAELLAQLDEIDGIDRIRYTSPHPKDMRADVIKAHAELPSVCEHIHLPLQSGSSAVLKRMRRTYTRERYLDRVAMIREHVPDCALTTDIIVGFPGETEHDFEQTLPVAERGRLRRRIHVPLLAAARHRRGRRSRTRSRTRSRSRGWSDWSRSIQRRAHERAQRFVGRTLDVLVEGPPGPIRAACAAVRATTRSSTSPASALPERSSRSRSPRPRARLSPARRRCLPRAAQ